MTPERKANQLYYLFWDHACDSPLGASYHIRHMCYICIGQVMDSLQHQTMQPEELKKIQDYWDCVMAEVSQIKE